MPVNVSTAVAANAACPKEEDSVPETFSGTTASSSDTS